MHEGDDVSDEGDVSSVEGFNVDIELGKLLSHLSATEEKLWSDRQLEQGIWQVANWFLVNAGSIEHAAQWKRFIFRSAKQAADRGDRDAAVFVAQYQLEAHLDVFLTMHREKAKKGERGSLVILPGLLAEMDPVEAAHWDEVAGSTGRAFWRSTRTHPPKGEAFVILGRRNFLIAARNGFPFAMERAGDAAVAVDDEEQAIHWYKAAAERERPGAMFSLYELLWTQDREASLTWLQQSAEGGFTPGMVTLANVLAGIDWDEAQKWLTRAKELGDPTADDVRNGLVSKRNVRSN